MSEPVTEGWVTTAEAAGLTGYSIPYIRQMAQRGRIEARKVGRDWLLHGSSLVAYKAQMQALGDGKHNPSAPWREDK